MFSHRWLKLLPFVFVPQIALGEPPSPEEIEFFESRIRPILAQDCYDCHSSEGKQRGGLALDHRAALLTGGDSGPAIMPGDPDSSLLMRAIRHESAELEMPKAGAKLEPEVLQDFAQWIAMGAPDPRDQPPSNADVAADTDWAAVMERRKRWWSFQPITDPSLENLPGDATAHPIDRFIARGLEEAGLAPNPEAEAKTLIRRLSFVLRGLPPSPEEIEAFAADPSETAYLALVDAYLNSPRFGERWARHWMDWVRYAETHGSEGDPAIPYAWRYRDYLIRALNADVPYDQLAQEHLAGDLLEQPRINRALGLNESAIGPAHLRMVFHGFAPTDALDEQVRFTDDQINVVSKAFLGLTVSCARCHDHKFDPISQKDFYAWYGIFASNAPASIGAEVPSEEEEGHRRRMAALKSELKTALIDAWLEDLEASIHRFASGETGRAAIEKAEQAHHLLHPWHLALKGENLGDWLNQKRRAPQAEKSPGAFKAWDLTQPNAFAEWTRDGRGVQGVSPNGEFAVTPEGPTILTGIYPAGVYSHGLTQKDRGVLLSPRFQLEGDHDLWLQVAGNGGSIMRYVVQNYPRDGTVYPVGRLNDGRWRWQRYPLKYWTGDHIHVEVSTAADQPVLANQGATRSWFGLRKVVVLPQGRTPDRNEGGALEALILEAAGGTPTPETTYANTLKSCLNAWLSNTLSESQSLFLQEALQLGLLANELDALPALRPLVEAYRSLESQLITPVRVPGVIEKDAFDQPLFDRGNHKRPLEPVARHFLDAIDGEAYPTNGSGRRALAEDLFRSDNPLTERVIVNRIWHHVFGEGLVRTPDNFGRLGQKPSHPQLLDHLATQFRRDGYSIKTLIRTLVSSRTWRASGAPSERALATDPDNRLLSHAHVRRLEAEALRDALLHTAGELDVETMYGPPAAGDSKRRSVYLQVRRNRLNPFLGTFDAPVPASTKGRRDVTNVPSQSLTLLNGRFIIATAQAWADSLKTLEKDARIERMFLSALGRKPSASEHEAALEYVEASIEASRDLHLKERHLETGIREATLNRQAITERARERMLEARGSEKSPTSATPNLPLATAYWEFEEDAKDAISGLEGTLHGNAQIVDGKLVLDGKQGSYVATSPLTQPLKSKTLMALVQLDDLEQRGGGVVSVQDLQGDLFDAIVFGEQAPRHWLAGSNFLHRTKAFGGTEEQEANEQWVHVALTYADDGTIRAYRQGQPYGESYRSDGPVTFEAGKAQILFGNRHGAPTEGRLLKGMIERAALYDRALSAEEVLAVATSDTDFISQADLEAAMTESEKEEFLSLEKGSRVLEEQLNALRSEAQGPIGWADLAHALLNLKEFLYIL